MWYVGMDVHFRQTVLCILDENGKKIKCVRIMGHWDRVLMELAQIQVPYQVCFEASCGYGHLYDRLKERAARVVVAHPGHLRLIFRAKKKNDRVDAEKLAKLLYLDEVPGVYVPSVDIRSWRSMIEQRQGLLNERTAVKNQLRALLRSEGIAAPKGLWTKKGLAWLQQVEWPTSLKAVQRDLQVHRVESLNQMVQSVDKVLGEIGQKHAGVTLLRTIPGVGIRTAEAVMAYIDDPHRFGKVNTIGSYFGLVPCQDQSADRNRLGHITKQGPHTVRRLVSEAAWQAIRRSPVVKAYFERIVQNDPDRKKIAIVATAHYLLRVMLSMLKTGEVWRASAA